MHWGPTRSLSSLPKARAQSQPAATTRQGSLSSSLSTFCVEGCLFREAVLEIQISEAQQSQLLLERMLEEDCSELQRAPFLRAVCSRFSGSCQSKACRSLAALFLHEAHSIFCSERSLVKFHTWIGLELTLLKIALSPLTSP